MKKIFALCLAALMVFSVFGSFAIDEQGEIKAAMKAIQKGQDRMSLNNEMTMDGFLKEAEKLLAQHPDTKLYVVGEYGRRYFDQHRIPIEHSFLYTAQNPTLDRAREISALLLDGFLAGTLKEIFVVYTDMENSLLSEAKSTRLLPFHRMQFAPPAKEKAVQEPFEFYPSVGAVLNSMIPSYVSGFLYSALLDSFCSEQNARMTAMDAANQNAEELLSALRLQYNRVRQAAITQEITEISAGAAAQRGTFGSEG